MYTKIQHSTGHNGRMLYQKSLFLIHISLFIPLLVPPDAGSCNYWGKHRMIP